MEIVLAPETASRIRAVLGDAVDLSPAAVPSALARLADEVPHVYSQVLNELSGSDIRLDSERVLHRRHRRTVVRRWLFGWGEYDSDAGDRLLAKRRVAAAVPIGLAFAMLSAAGLAGLVHPARRATSAPPSSAHRAVPAPKTAIAPVLPPFSSQVPSAWSRVLSGRAAAAGMPAVARPSPLPLVPVPSLPSLPPVLVRQGGDGPPPSIVFDRTSSSGSGATQAVARPPLPPVVYSRDAEPDAGSSPGRTPGTRGRQPGTAAADANASFRAGDMIAARLLTGVVVAAGVPVPVVADAGDGVKWIGRAAAGAGGRVDIAFTLPAAGVAFDPEHVTAGLPAKAVFRRRGAAAAAIAAVGQAAADYTQAVARAGQVTVAEGATQITVGGAAPGWTYAASRLADALSPQASGTIETLEVPAGTRCLIVITGAP